LRPKIGRASFASTCKTIGVDVDVEAAGEPANAASDGGELAAAAAAAGADAEAEADVNAAAFASDIAAVGTGTECCSPASFSVNRIAFDEFRNRSRLL
jgi:hypothetical protein